MNAIRRFGLCAVVVATCARLSAGLGDLVFGSNELQTITVTDLTDAGRQAPAASPQRPQFYAAISGGYHDFGGIMAGEKPVKRAAVNQLMIDVLAKQGYLPAKPGQQADIIVVWTWGTLNTIVEDVVGDTTLPHRYVNEVQLLRFLGASKLGMYDQTSTAFPELTLAPGAFYAGGDRQRLWDTAHDNLYVAVVAAYDTKLDGRGRATLLWNTRISSPARGFWLPDALPAMVAMAAPFIGHETDRPMWVKASDKFKPDVQIGDLRVVEYLRGTEKTVVNVGDVK
jgi:hypothetical protein